MTLLTSLDTSAPGAAPGRPPQILVVEDEPKTRAAIAEALKSEGADVMQASRGREMLAQLGEHPFDLIILDWLLPGRDGLELIRGLRARGWQIPILLLSGCHGMMERVLGLGCGADDFLAKPFAVAELIARCRARLRRPLMNGSEFLRCQTLRLDVRNRLASRDHEPIPLTLRETELLEYLFRHQGQAISRDTLAREIWHEPHRRPSLNNVIDAQMMRLRKKLDGERPEKLLHTLRGIGYRLGDERRTLAFAGD